ncbi:MAG: FAD-containing monooxygenase EthA [Rhodobiaceae bacterium]|nr:FAD-containing monooxygenase EthA [Rhodobiaceae bacterium]
MEHFDVIVVGAGISGIGAGYHLQKNCPNKSYMILEGRDKIGGTWDLFKYPGIRSDSDMYTLGYSFKPWTKPKAIADAPSILSYLNETAEEHGIDKKIRYGHQVKNASWSSADAKWTVDVELGEDKTVSQFTCSFLFMCAGYYSYKGGYTPDFPGLEDYQGRLVHPQKWTDDIDYTDKKVVVIGSGATAVTLIPELAKKATHVTMLQRSPTYVVSRPAEDKLANTLRRYLPAKLAYGITRWKNVLLGMYFYNLCRTKPEMVKKRLLDEVRKELGPDFDVDKHFNPTYNPWDQRLCLVPDSDMFQALKTGKASVATDHIETFTADGIRLKSGEELKADLVVSATGLQLEVLGGLRVNVDGKPVEFSKALTYKGMMYSDVPNLASSFGYTNASWTLKCDLTCEYLCRLINHMDKAKVQQATPRIKDANVEVEPWLDLTSGYVQRAKDILPKQGTTRPWKLYQNYALDIMMLGYGAVDDGTMEFAKATPANMNRAAAQVAAE